MKTRNENGFSLIELLLVVAIVGIISALAVPYLQKAVRASENQTTFASMRSLSSTQMSFYGQHNRWGRLSEINNIMSNAIGTPSGNDVVRGRFVLSMEPPTWTDTQLKDRYTIRATRNVVGEDTIYIYELTESGSIVQVSP